MAWKAHFKHRTARALVLDGLFDVYLGGTVFVGARLLSLLELSLAAQVGANTNSIDDPNTRFTAGDLFPSAKIGYEMGSMAFGFDLRGALPTAQNAAGVDLGNAAVAGTGIYWQVGAL